MIITLTKRELSIIMRILNPITACNITLARIYEKIQQQIEHQ